MGFGKLESVTHTGESLLGKLRDGQIQLQSDTTTGLLSLVDAIREMLGNIEQAGTEGETDFSDLIKTLIRLQEAEMTGEVAPGGDEAQADAPPSENSPPTTSNATQSSSTMDDSTDSDDSATDSELDGDSHQRGISETTIRVDVSVLDKLMNRVGELVLARNQILQSATALSDPAFLSTSQRLNLITTELQEGVMKTRMQPIDKIWGKFPRLVRDLAVQCGKQVRIEMDGRETELDKTIIEAIKDPLTHLLRNSVDHGIEMPEVRRANGKPAEGRLLLRAFHEGGRVNIEITDDGAGLDLERILQKAIERGTVSQDQASRMSDREIGHLIFAAGFSTAGQVTNVSGRGVGMDVVKTNIEKIGGTVDVQSQPGQGTTIKIKIPLTLAIIPALIVTCDGNRFAIPQVSLLELVRLDGEQARKKIERLHGAPVYRLRGRLLPIVRLRQELGLDNQSATEQSTADDEVINIVVLRADDRQFGLVVDAINDTEEIVVKPLSKQLKDVPTYAGATIMGDGKVALILDVLGVAQQARVVSEVRDRSIADNSTSSEKSAADRETFLILSVGDRRLALNISLVSRLEEILRADTEKANDLDVVQYRGQIMPLLHLGRMLDIPTEEDPDRPLQVVVHSNGNRCVGLIVDRVVDIVETTIDVTRPSLNDDLLASIVVQQRVTDLINVETLIRRADPVFYESSIEEAAVV